MKTYSIKTYLVKPGDPIEPLLDQCLVSVQEGMVVAITSKVISLCQRRVVSKQDVNNKYELIKKEADAYLKDSHSAPHGAHLTIKNHILIPSAGIDESNGENTYILYPHDIQGVALKIWRYLRGKHKVNSLGVLITDSHTTPLRKGVTGIALGWCGFQPLYSYVGQPDIFGRPLRVTQINILDALASTAVFVMGEGAEQTPMAILEDVPKIQFLPRPPSQEEEHSIFISLEEDIYAPLLKSNSWVWNDCKKRGRPTRI